MLEMQESNNLLFCPSFNSYSSDGLPEIAAKVCDEFETKSRLNEEEVPQVQDSQRIDEEDDFEFSPLLGHSDASADEIFFHGQIRPIFHLFNRDLFVHGDRDREIKATNNLSAIRIPLKELFMEEREDREPPSTSSSEAEEMETVPPGTYCVWRPKAVESSPSKSKIKSNSTGSASKRCKFRDLLRRSNSDGKDSFVFLTSKNSKKVEASKERRNSGDVVKVAGKVKAKRTAAGEKAPSSAHEAFYVRNRAMKEGDKRKSYLPYRPDLVGLFANVGPLGKALHPS